MMKAMIGLMTGVQDSLLEIAGGMKRIKEDPKALPPRQGRKGSVKTTTFEINRPISRTKEFPEGVKYPMGSNKSPEQYLEKHREYHEEWYAVANG